METLVADNKAELEDIGRKVRASAQKLATLSSDAKNQAIFAIAKALEIASPEIVAANFQDLKAAEGNIDPALYARLKLDGSKLAAAIVGVEDVANLADPVGAMQINRELDDGLILQRISCPVGVLGVIFEARPDAVIQIASLAIKSGNGVILKGGKEAINSCSVLVKVIREALTNTAVDPDVIQLLTTREETLELLKLDRFVDLIIPRGSNSFVRFVQDNTRIPVLGHADGICHLYVDRDADIDRAITISIDAKLQYTAACNAIETLLVHRDIAATFLPKAIVTLQEKGTEIRGDSIVQKIAASNNLSCQPTTDADWETEYSAAILAIKVVNDTNEAIEHINTYGSRHTECIVTESAATAKEFISRIDAAGVYHNCSTRFADGFRYGFGAEVGISTQKMPPRGPVGLEGLVTYKYILCGSGQIAATYTGENAKSFTHRDVPFSV
jgi:glutamate-5-semialdehyde dehydrogenase